MYSLFKDSLLAPSRIPNHLKDKKIIFFLFTLILIIFYALPSIISFSFQGGVQSTYVENLGNNFLVEDKVNYKLENNELVSKTSDKTVSTVFVDAFGTVFSYPILLIFDDCEESANYEDTFYLAKEKECFKGNLYSKVLLVSFHKKDLQFAFVQNSFVSQSSGLFQSQVLTDTSSSDDVKINVLYKKTISYSTLNLSNVDFSLGKANSSNYDFKLGLSGMVNSLFHTFKVSFGWAIILGVILDSIIHFFLSVLIISGLSFFLYRMYQVSFKNVFKIVMIAMGPTVICTILASCFNLALLTYVGMFITIFFTVRAMRQMSINPNKEE